MRLGIRSAIVCLLLLSGCAHVAPYERGRLAHPTMRMTELAEPAEVHVYSVHEGAAGGTVGASSGCGCN